MVKKNKDKKIELKSRKVDTLGRVMFPLKLTRLLGYDEWQPIEMSIERGFLCFRKFDRNAKDLMQREHIGIVREIDEMHRLVIPKEFRDVLGIKIHDILDSFLEGETIKMRKPPEEIEE